KRTVRIVLFANEENGLAGARAYAKAHAGELEKHVLAVEADLGAGTAYGIRALTGAEARQPLEDLATLLRPLGVAETAEHAQGGADLIPLRAAGVPLVDVAQDAETYFDIHHTANDTFDKIDPSQLAQATAAYATVIAFAAATPASFGRIPEAQRERR